MRPTAHELIESVRHSLREIVLPAVDDEWARYVATCADKLLVAVQVRMDVELASLALDTAETAALLAELRSRLGAEGSPALADLSAALDRDDLPVVLDPAQADGLAARLAGADDEARARLAEIVDRLYAAERAELSPADRATVTGAHDLVRAHLRRQLARDVELMAPTFMAFGDPARVSGTRS